MAIRWQNVIPTYIILTLDSIVTSLAFAAASERSNGNTGTFIHTSIVRHTADISGRLTAITSVYHATNVVAITFEAIREGNGILTARIVHAGSRRASICTVHFTVCTGEYWKRGGRLFQYLAHCRMSAVIRYFILEDLHSQYHACWCPGNFRSQCISRHGFDLQRKFNALKFGSRVGTPATLLVRHPSYLEQYNH